MLNRNYGSSTSNIGLGAVQGAVLPAEQDNIGTLIASGIAGKKAKDNMMQRYKQLDAYSEALKKAHPGDEAKIDALGALDAGSYYDALAAADKERQDKLDYLAQQNRDAVALENLRTSNDRSLAEYRNRLSRIAADGERDRQMQAIEEAVKNGTFTPQQGNIARMRLALGKVADGVLPDGAGLPDELKNTNGAPQTGEIPEIPGMEGKLTGNPTYDKEIIKIRGKTDAEKAENRQALDELRPSVLEAMRRARNAAESGNGIGRIGGSLVWLGLNPAKNAGRNYADVQNANSSMNAYLRKQLQALNPNMGATEMNTAAEAEAYRYQISPTDSESVIRRKLENFARDKMGIDPEMLKKAKKAKKYDM